MSNFASLQNVKDFLGITASTDDDLITALLGRTTRMMQMYVGRDLIQATYTDEKYDGNGIDQDLNLRQYPIISVSSVYDDPDRVFGADSLLTEDNGSNDGQYIIYQKGEIDNQGIIRRVDGAWIKGKQNIKVTYTAGYATVPEDLVQAQIDFTSFLYKNRDQRLGISGYRIGSYSVTYKDNSSGDATGAQNAIPADIRSVLDNYRDPRMESTFG